MNQLRKIKKAKKGDKKALLFLVMDRKDEYYRLAYSYLKDENDSLNALQDMILKLYENIGSLREEDKFYTWSKTILVNICKDNLRAASKLIPTENLDLYESPVEENFDEKIYLEEILSKLSPIYREIIGLKYFLDYDYKSISEILNIPLGTVKSRLYKGRKELEKIYSGGGRHVR